MMEDTYQKTTHSQEDGKKLEVKSTQTLAPNSPTSVPTDTQGNSGSTSTSQKIKNVTIPVTGLSFKITKG
jgi:hypothetical protein